MPPRLGAHGGEFPGYAADRARLLYLRVRTDCTLFLFAPLCTSSQTVCTHALSCPRGINHRHNSMQRLECSAWDAYPRVWNHLTCPAATLALSSAVLACTCVSSELRDLQLVARHAVCGGSCQLLTGSVLV